MLIAKVDAFLHAWHKEFGSRAYRHCVNALSMSGQLVCLVMDRTQKTTQCFVEGEPLSLRCMNETSVCAVVRGCPVGVWKFHSPPIFHPVQRCGLTYTLAAPFLTRSFPGTVWIPALPANLSVQEGRGSASASIPQGLGGPAGSGSP